LRYKTNKFPQIKFTYGKKQNKKKQTHITFFILVPLKIIDGVNL